MGKQYYKAVSALLVLAVVLAGCGQTVTSPTSPAGEPETVPPEIARESSYVWNQLLNRDSIRPIYDPEFVPADQAGYSDDELVMGVAIDGEAKAYPIGVLTGREMVNDELGGTPILVTW